MISAAHRPSAWLLAPAAVTLALLSFAHRDTVFPSICFLGIVGSYFHSRRVSLPKRHPWLASIIICAALFLFCLLYYWTWLLSGEGISYFHRFWYKPWLVSTGAMLQATVLLWAWHLPSRPTGLIFACMGLIAISSGNILPTSYGIVNLYALFGGTCLLSLFALSGAFNCGWDQPFREQCRQSIVVLAYIAIIGAGTWYISASVQHISQRLDTLHADFMSGSHYRDTIGAGHEIRIAHQRDVKLSRRVVATLSGSQSPVYLRTQVMTQYQHHRWTPSSVPPPEPLRTRTSQDTSHREMRLHVNLRGAVPLPYGVTQVRIPEPLSCRQSAGSVVHCSPASLLKSYSFASHAPQTPIPYGIGFAMPAPHTEPSLSALSQSLQDALSGPETVLSQLRPIARRIAGADATHALAAAQHIQQYFRQHFSYSLRVKLSPERDPIVDFVQNRRPAYCEYFASGMALMLRSLGIPARVAGGFLVWEYNALLKQWIVRQRDAHAWVEVYDDFGQRWVGFDATPAFRQERFSRTGLIGFLHQSRAWVELQARAIVKQIYQIDFIAWFIRLRQLRTWFGPIAARSLVLAALIVSAYWLWRRFYPSIYQWWKQLRWPVRRRSSRAQDPLPSEAQQHFDHIAILLQQWGLPILPTETLEEYLERLSSRAYEPPGGREP
ncbi:transglutaminase-like domain-containing protein [Candidatus Entotheonella palauensis]|uniref:transglutaminase-like domain-containing protein n=1 Tax=Candidatus Entotheonella palauensis TaxID=93172 RepID=UPI0015C45125|nr:transglutaminase-like domain-containing protein [Candidatus Entotheonella palauensis]